jgi:hypothetical protein
LLAAHPDVDGILGYYAAQDALAKAGLKLPATGFTFPPAMKGCVDRNNPCLLAGQPPWSSAQALKDAIAIKDGTSKYTKPGFIPFPVPFFVNNSKVKPAKSSTLGDTYPLKPQFESAPEGAFLPVSPPWAKIPFDEIVG